MKGISLSDKNNVHKGVDASIVKDLSVLSAVWMTLVAPIVIAFVITDLFSSEGASTSLVYWVLIAIFVMVHVLLSVLTFRASSKPSTTIEVDALIEDERRHNEIEIPGLKGIYETARAQQLVTYLTTIALDECIAEAKKGAITLSDALSKMLSPLVGSREVLFRFGSDGLYNFALYVFDGESQELKLAWRSHDNRIKTSNRSWKPGFGHVGLTYIHNEIKVCSDISKSTELGGGKPGDEKKYRSFLSTPIKVMDVAGDSSKPAGVLVITSSKTNQFDFDRDKNFVLTLAKIVGLLIGELKKPSTQSSLEAH